MKIVKNLPLVAAFIGIVLFLFWLGGAFSHKVPGNAAASPSNPFSGEAEIVRLKKIPLVESAVGTVQAAHEAIISSRILARIVELKIRAGQVVKRGDILARLDDTDIRAKLRQADANEAMAEAAQKQAVIDEKRLGILIKSNAVSQQDYDRALTRLKTSDAELVHAKEFVNEIRTMLEYATIVSPMDGIVVDRKVEVGDMASPGQPLLKIFDPSHMQLLASVRESLTHRLQIGQSIGVRIDALNKLCSGTVSEIVPEANSASRSFQVKVTGPCPAGVYSGMFGRIMIPLGEEEILLIPDKAVKRVGQLELVDVVEDGQLVRRSIRTGKKLGDEVEVLSGLKPDEQLAIHTLPGSGHGK